MTITNTAPRLSAPPDFSPQGLFWTITGLRAPQVKLRLGEGQVITFLYHRSIHMRSTQLKVFQRALLSICRCIRKPAHTTPNLKAFTYLLHS